MTLISNQVVKEVLTPLEQSMETIQIERSGVTTANAGHSKIQVDDIVFQNNETTEKSTFKSPHSNFKPLRMQYPSTMVAEGSNSMLSSGGQNRYHGKQVTLNSQLTKQFHNAEKRSRRSIASTLETYNNATQPVNLNHNIIQPKPGAATAGTTPQLPYGEVVNHGRGLSLPHVKSKVG